MSDPIIPTPENPIPDVDDIKPGIPSPAWPDEGSGGGSGTGSGVLVANANVETGALDKTWNEIKNSTLAFIVVNVAQSKIISFVAYIGAGEDGKYYIGAISYMDGAPTNMGLLRLVTDSADGYPVLQDN